MYKPEQRWRDKSYGLSKPSNFLFRINRHPPRSASDTIDVHPRVISNGKADFQLALELFSERRIPAALELLFRAERAGYDPAECAAYRWSCWMLSGDFERAWRESDRIAALGRPDPNRFWDGRPFRGKRVLIRCLHGYGDAIQFIRYARLVKREASRVIVQTHPELVSLMRGIPYLDRVITWPDDSAEELDWEQQIEVMELPRAFRTTLRTVPSEVPYLHIPAATTKRSRISSISGKRPRIGLQWGASEWNPARSIPLSALSKVLRLSNFDFYSFQRGPVRAELNGIGRRFRIRDIGGNSPEISRTAATLADIDLLISVDTMLAHLAGALAIPVWVLLPYEADWRWMLGRQDTPWYPTMRLFRQPAKGDWKTPVLEIATELLDLFNDAGSVLQNSQSAMGARANIGRRPAA